MNKCHVCFVKYESRNLLINHIKLIHPFIKIYKCLSCLNYYDKIKSFGDHICRNSFSEYNAFIPKESEKTLPNNDQVFEIENFAYDSDNSENDSVLNSDRYEEIVFEFIVSLLEKSNISRKDVFFILKNVATLITKSFELFSELKNKEKNVKKFCTYLNTVFGEVNTETKLFSFLKKLHSLILPKKIIIGHDTETSNVRGVQPHKEYSVSYVSLVDTLECLIKNKAIFKNIIENQNMLQNETTCISNITQGRMWKEKISTITADYVFPFFIFYDDFETGNPLGSHATIQKLGGVYGSVPLISNDISSKLENIFLISLFYSSDQKLFGYDTIFSKLVEDIILLETKGINIKMNGAEINVKFVLALILGDNLGLNSILGFSEGFRSNYYCRFCVEHRNKCSSDYLSKNFTLRTKEIYEEQLILKNVKETGIRDQCVFSKINSFNVVNNKTVDIMHDLFEGVCPIIISFVLNSLFSDQSVNVSLITLNEKIKYFDFKKSNESRFSLISNDSLKKNTIKMSASEMISFSKYLCLLIGDLIPVDNKFWDLYLYLREIISIVLQNNITKELTIYLQTIIQEMLELYLLLSKKSLTPKMHFLLHYNHAISYLGPLSKIWSMRFEGHHKVFKDIARICKNRINMPFSLSLRYQLKKYSQNFISNNVCTTVKIPKKFTLLSNYDSNFREDVYMRFGNELVKVYNWVMYNNIRYSKDCIILISSNEHGTVFGCIKFILSITNNIVFAYEKLKKSEYFNRHYFAYEIDVEKNDMIDYINSEELLKSEHPFPLVYKKFGNKLFVCLT